MLAVPCPDDQVYIDKSPAVQYVAGDCGFFVVRVYAGGRLHYRRVRLQRRQRR